MSMGGLDSGMEAAAAINYLRQLESMNYVWAWIAFLTAAVSFWRMKLSSIVVRLHHLNSPCCLSSTQTETTTDDDQQKPQEEEEEELPSTASLISPMLSSSAFCSMENRRSGKFSMYYYNNNNNEQQLDTSTSVSQRHEDEEEEEEEKQERCFVEGGGLEWEPVLLKAKTSLEMVWYNYQDLTLLNGNVVRFWN